MLGGASRRLFLGAIATLVAAPFFPKIALKFPYRSRLSAIEARIARAIQIHDDLIERAIFQCDVRSGVACIQQSELPTLRARRAMSRRDILGLIRSATTTTPS